MLTEDESILGYEKLVDKAILVTEKASKAMEQLERTENCMYIKYVRHVYVFVYVCMDVYLAVCMYGMYMCLCMNKLYMNVCCVYI